MKYIRILSICIFVGMLLSGCKTTMLTATSIQHQQPLPNYVKHNQGLPKKAKSIPYITVQLYPNPKNPNQRVIQYFITDMDGIRGCTHWIGATNCPNERSSSLYTTTFPPDKDIEVKRTNDKKEVIIQGTATDGKCYAWRSDSKRYPDSNMKDSDVRWKSVPCE